MAENPPYPYPPNDPQPAAITADSPASELETVEHEAEALRSHYEEEKRDGAPEAELAEERAEMGADIAAAENGDPEPLKDSVDALDIPEPPDADPFDSRN